MVLSTELGTTFFDVKKPKVLEWKHLSHHPMLAYSPRVRKSLVPPPFVDREGMMRCPSNLGVTGKGSSRNHECAAVSARAAKPPEPAAAAAAERGLWPAERLARQRQAGAACGAAEDSRSPEDKGTLSSAPGVPRGVRKLPQPLPVRRKAP